MEIRQLQEALVRTSILLLESNRTILHVSPAPNVDKISRQLTVNQRLIEGSGLDIPWVDEPKSHLITVNGVEHLYVGDWIRFEDVCRLAEKQNIADYDIIFGKKDGDILGNLKYGFSMLVHDNLQFDVHLAQGA